jgi:excisionase family DNA binding protein
MQSDRARPEKEIAVSELLTKAEVADLLKLSPRSVDRLRVLGDLPAMKVLSMVRFRRQDVEAYLEAQRKAVAQ